MGELTRFGISLDKELLQGFDRWSEAKGYDNRSEAIRDLIRSALVREQWRQGEEVVGVIVMVYDHHQRQLTSRLTELQHDYFHRVVASQHVHLDHDNCLEVAVVRGKASEIEELADRLKTFRGVKHCSLSAATTGKGIV
jgi:CopG family nickel-responsive transcriptional regulator